MSNQLKAMTTDHFVALDAINRKIAILNIISNNTIDNLGNQNIEGNTVIGGNLTVEGLLTINGTTFLGSEFSVGNSSNFHDVYIDGTLGVMREANFSNNIYVSNSVHINDNLYVTDNANVQGVLTVNGPSFHSNNASFFGDLYLEGNLTVDTFSNFNDNVTIDGLLTSNSLSVLYDTMLTGNTEIYGTSYLVGNTTLGNTLTVYGVSSFNGMANINNNLYVQYGTQINDWLTVGGDTNLDGNVIVSNTSTLSGNVYILGHTSASDMTVSNITANDGVFLGDLTIYGENTNIHGDFKVHGTSNLTGGLTTANVFTARTLYSNTMSLTTSGQIDGDLSVGCNTILGNILHANSVLQIYGSTTMGNGSSNSDLTVNGDVVIGSIDVNSNLYLNGNLLIGSNGVNADVILYGNSNMTENLVIGGIVDITGNITGSSSLTISGLSTLSNANVSTLRVSGLSTLSNTIVTSGLSVGNVSVNAPLTLYGNTNLYGNLTVSNIATVNGNLTSNNITSSNIYTVGLSDVIKYISINSSITMINTGIVIFVIRNTSGSSINLQTSNIGEGTWDSLNAGATGTYLLSTLESYVRVH
jgi:NDP-sugar pyrophosphorylase family protein